MVVAPASLAAIDLQALDEAQLRELSARLICQLQHTQALNDKRSHEMALLRRLKFAGQSEHLSAEQRHLFEESLEADLVAVEAEIAQLQTAHRPPESDKQSPKRQALPA